MAVPSTPPIQFTLVEVAVAVMVQGTQASATLTVPVVTQPFEDVMVYP